MLYINAIITYNHHSNNSISFNTYRYQGTLGFPDKCSGLGQNKSSVLGDPDGYDWTDGGSLNPFIIHTAWMMGGIEDNTIFAHPRGRPLADCRYVQSFFISTSLVHGLPAIELFITKPRPRSITHLILYINTTHASY